MRSVRAALCMLGLTSWIPFDSSASTSLVVCFFFFSSRRRHTRSDRDWSSDVCSSDLTTAYDDPAFTIYDAAAGVGKANWEAQLFIQNFNDERAVTWANYREFVKSESIAPPRTVGLRMTYRFSEK